MFTNEQYIQLAKEMVERVQQRRKVKEQFFCSGLFNCMMRDMLNKGGVLDSECFAYFPETVRSHFGWHDISDKDIKMFINVMHDRYIGEIKNSRSDENCPFVNYTFEKCGITVDVIIGQGTSVSLSVVKE